MTKTIMLSEIAEHKQPVLNEYVEPKFKRAEPCFQECLDGINCAYPRCKGIVNENV